MALPPTLIRLLLALALAAPNLAAAQGRPELIAACRDDAASLCAGVRPGGGAILRCLADHRETLSERCRDTLAAARQRPPAPAVAERVQRDLPYGDDPAQRMDIYMPAHARNAPVLLMVHGGGWRGGSKSAAGVIANKVAHWVPRGFVVISVEYRLLPAADPLAQAEDVARALASAQRRAREFGADPGRFVLMGHSSGAHLVMLLNADPAIARRLGAHPWRGLVALDSGAYDVSAIMTRPHMRFYDEAFGADPAYWRRASPQARLRPGGPPALLVCSSLRPAACPSAESYAAAARHLGDRVEVLPTALSHSAIDDDLGRPGAYTESVDRFIAAVTR